MRTDLKEVLQRLRPSLGEKTDRLLKTLGEAGVSVAGSRMMEDVHREARDYYWVEFRGGPS